MGILFAIGVGVGMSEDNDGTGGLAAVSYTHLDVYKRQVCCC